MTALGQVAKGASWEELIQACVQSFDEDGNVCHSSQLLNIILTMHRLLLPPKDLLDKMVTLFKSTLEGDNSTECLKMCYLIQYWISEFWTMFRLHNSLTDSLEQFKELMKEHGQEKLCPLLQTKWMGDREWSQKASQKIKASNKKRKVSLLFDHLEPVELAEHLTYLEFKSFCRISFVDYQKYIKNECLTENPAMERSIALCNGISQWVQLMVLSRPSAQLRAEVFTKFIYVAQNLQQMQNFNTLMAVVGGLCHSSISRLKDTCTYVPNETNKVLNEMTDLLSSSRNYENYRQAYCKCTGFKIPILGVHLKDLIAVNEAMTDYVENGKINVQKLQSLYNHISELIQLQHNPPLLDANKDLVHLLTLSLDLYYTEDEIYELSYAREPRNHRAPPATPYRPPVLVDWASGVAPKPDPKTISKHVQRMVDSVFTNYDHDGNGFISQEDFEKIAASFPFSFCVMDKDKDGLISRDEIMAYFMRASVICSKLGLGFSHNFQETTYMRPTFCDNCSGFLWGVIKQGYRCRDCGMNCHKSCKDQVAFECKKNIKSSSNVDWSPPSNTTDTTADWSPPSNTTDTTADWSPPSNTTDTTADWSPPSNTTDTTVAGGHDDENQFIHSSDAPADYAECLSSTSHTSFMVVPSRNFLVHRSTQTEAVSAASQLQPCLLSPSPTTLTPCPSPVPQRKRSCANKTSTTLIPGEEKLTYEALEKENNSLMKSNENLRRKLKEAERDVEILKTLLKRHTLRPVEEDSSSSS